MKKSIADENVANITTFSALQDLVESQILENKITYDVLLTEVVEHMSLQEAEKLISDILTNITINMLIISTPNKHFNIHYGIDLRHADHKWEMKSEEFELWINNIVASATYKKDFFGSGCVVDGQAITTVVIITQQKN